MKDDADMGPVEDLDRYMAPEDLADVKRMVDAERPDLVRRIAVAKAARRKAPKVEEPVSAEREPEVELSR